MATAVENPSIASAKERAASILYGNEKPVAPVIAEYSMPVKEEVKSKPTFASYYPPESVRAVPRPTEYRSYETISEPVMTQEPRVMKPFISQEEFFARPVETPTMDTTPVAVTSKNVASEIDTELDADTQYVVKFKKSTLVAAAVLTTIFVLMAVLFIVNLVSLSSAAAEINTLNQNAATLNQELNQAMRENEQAHNAAIAAAQGNSKAPSGYISQSSIHTYTPTSTSAGESDSGFFDWVCHALSNLFG